MKITYLPLTPDATGYYRCLAPAKMLARNGHEIRLPFEERKSEDGKRWLWVMDIDKLKARPDQPDMYVIQMRWERHWHQKVMHDLRAKGVALVVECDDNYLETPEWNPSFQTLHPYRNDLGVISNREARRSTGQLMYVREKTGRKVSRSVAASAPSGFNRLNGLEMMKQADAVIVSTPYLKELYSKYNHDVRIVRNSLDWDMWEDVQPQYEVYGRRLRIGYSGVFTYRKGDLGVIRDVLPRVLARHPEVDFVANSEAVHDFFDVRPEQRITIPEYAFYNGRMGDFPVGEKTATCDIGLVPLLPGGMAEGKSHLKGMEYNGAGIPYIASNTESYRYWTRHWRNGVIAEDEHDWEELLEILIADDDRRRKMGKRGREIAEDFSIQNQWWRWDDSLSQILGDIPTQNARGAIKRGAVQKISELSSLLREVEKAKPKVVVEVGSAAGGTFWALAEHADDDALLVSIDMPAGSPLDVRDGHDVYSNRDRERMRSYVKPTQRCVLLDGNSQSQEMLDRLIDTLGSAKIDVLFIDADHRYQGVKRDFELYSPLVKPGGLIAFHDMIPQNDVRSGVHVLWRELKKRYATTEFIGRDSWGHGSWGGIGLVRT